MLQGIEYLRSARRHLAHEDIEQAAEHLWKAMFYLDSWPDDLQQRANALLPRMFSAGPIATSIRQMSRAEHEALHRQMLVLIDEALLGDGVALATAAQYLPVPSCRPDGSHVGSWAI
jgi:hypothetical protein